MDYRLRCKKVEAVFAKKRVSQQELKARLLAVQRMLFAHDREAQARAEKAREAAKASLRLGDDRGFHREGSRYSLAARQGEMVRGMLLTVRSMLDVAEAQIGLKEITAIGDKLQEAQKNLGIDPRPMEQGLAQMRHGVDYVNQAALQMTKTMKMYALEEARPEELEEIRKAFMVEILNETTMGKRVKQDIHGDKEHTVEKKGR